MALSRVGDGVTMNCRKGCFCPCWRCCCCVRAEQCPVCCLFLLICANSIQSSRLHYCVSIKKKKLYVEFFIPKKNQAASMARPFIHVSYEPGSMSQARDTVCNGWRGDLAFRREKHPFVYRKTNVSEAQLRQVVSQLI